MTNGSLDKAWIWILVLAGTALRYVSLRVGTTRMRGREVLGTSEEVLGSKRYQREAFWRENSNNDDRIQDKDDRIQDKDVSWMIVFHDKESLQFEF